MAKVKSQKDPEYVEELDSKDTKVINPCEQILAFMEAKENKDDHYNFQPGKYYRVSTGSLKLDILTGGGITPGVVRFVGQNSGGKTSEALELCRNFFLGGKNRRAIYVKAEGRLSQEMQTRSGITFVLHPNDWLDGTCLIYESNIFESICSLMDNLIRNNPTGQEYLFIIDSLDGMILREDMKKPFEDCHKIAGPQTLGTKLMQKLSLPLVKFGHILAFTSQVRAQPKIDPYAKMPHRDFSSSGGNWALHYPDYILEFTPRFQSHLILKDPKAKYSEAKNPIIGHLAAVTVQKSNNEKNKVQVTYPIRYGRSAGTSIWIEREVGDTLASYYCSAKGAWLYISPILLEELKSNGIEMPEKINGIEKLYTFLEENKHITQFLFEKFKAALKRETVIADESDPLEEEEKE